MNKIEIEIPDNKEIDWEASAKQKQIVFKDKQITYKDVCEKLFKNGYCYTDVYGRIIEDAHNQISLTAPNTTTTRHQLECILAKNKLANVARYLNGEWEWKLGSHTAFFIMGKSSKKSEICLDIKKYSCYSERPNVLFKSKEAAQQAIEILGKETIKLALTPLY